MIPIANKTLMITMLSRAVPISIFLIVTFCISFSQRSVLGHMLPEAMICYLEHYEPEKFAEIFLGEFDTPEAIWNAEMR